MKTDFSSLYDSDKFRKDGYAMIDLLATYLEIATVGTRKVTNYVDPDDELEFWTSYDWSDSEQFYKDLLDHLIQLHSPNYMGHQVSVPLPELALSGLFSDLLNNGMGIYEMGQGATAIERIVIRQIATIMGLPDDADGFLTSGGTLANLTALLAARAHFWKSHEGGHVDNSDLCIMASEQVHYCVKRAASTMGLPDSNLVLIPVDNAYRMDIKCLREMYQEIISSGKKVIAVVGSACSTSTGSYDSLSHIGKFCREKHIWFHVDGAHGLAAAFSQKYKHLVEGVEIADSVVVDTHKMMLVPALATAVIFKHSGDSYLPFNQEAEYLFEEKEGEWFQLAKRTYETTKYMMSIKVFHLFQAHGTEFISSYVERQFDLARTFAKRVQEDHELELGHTPQSNIVCFRWNPGMDNQKRLNQLNGSIREIILSNGTFYIVRTYLQGKFFLRTTIMNPITSIENLLEMIEEVKKVGRQLMNTADEIQ